MSNKFKKLMQETLKEDYKTWGELIEKACQPPLRYIFIIAFNNEVRSAATRKTSKELKAAFVKHQSSMWCIDEEPVECSMPLDDGSELETWTETSDFRLFLTPEQALGEGKRVMCKNRVKYRMFNTTPKTKRQAIDRNWKQRNVRRKFAEATGKVEQNE